MKRKYLASAVAILGFLLPSARQGFAQALEATNPEPIAGVSAPAAPAVKHALVTTLIDRGAIDGKLPKGKTFYTLDNPARIDCTVNCTVEFDALVQFGNNSASNNQVSVCAVVDGKVISDCLLQVTLPTNKTYVTVDYLWSVAVKKGAHTLQTAAYVTTPTDVGDFTAIYRQYQP